MADTEKKDDRHLRNIFITKWPTPKNKDDRQNKADRYLLQKTDYHVKDGPHVRTWAVTLERLRSPSIQPGGGGVDSLRSAYTRAELVKV